MWSSNIILPFKNDVRISHTAVGSDVWNKTGGAKGRLGSTWILLFQQILHLLVEYFMHEKKKKTFIFQIELGWVLISICLNCYSMHSSEPTNSPVLQLLLWTCELKEKGCRTRPEFKFLPLFSPGDVEGQFLRNTLRCSSAVAKDGKTAASSLCVCAVLPGSDPMKQDK